MIVSPVIISPKISAEKMDNLIGNIKTKVGTVVPENITTATALIMAEVRLFTELNNSEKKELVCHLLYKLIENEPQETWNKIDETIRKIVPNAIDTLVDVSKGKINVRKLLRKPITCGCSILNLFRNVKEKKTERVTTKKSSRF